MRIVIDGKISADPKDRILAIEAVTQSICEATGQDVAEGVMMLLAAAAHLHHNHAKKGLTPKDTMTNLAECLGDAIVAADDFFKLKPIT